jgi:hypothetical protein
MKQFNQGPWVIPLVTFQICIKIRIFGTVNKMFTCVNDTGDKLLPVSLVLAPCPGFSSIPWHRRLIYHRYEQHRKLLITGNNDTGDNLLPESLSTTLLIKLLDEYKSAYTFKLTFGKMNFIGVNCKPIASKHTSSFIFEIFTIFVKIQNG